MNWTVVICFLVVLTLFTMSGALAWLKKQKTPEDYLVASREVAPWLTALSTVATNNSGFMFIGMIAYTYRLGIEAVWMMAGLVYVSFMVGCALLDCDRPSKSPRMVPQSGCGTARFVDS